MVGTACEDIDAIVDYGIPELADPYGPWGTWSSIKHRRPLEFSDSWGLFFLSWQKRRKKRHKYPAYCKIAPERADLGLLSAHKGEGGGVLWL